MTNKQELEDRIDAYELVKQTTINIRDLWKANVFINAMQLCYRVKYGNKYDSKYER